jgi:uncharacterized protein
MRLCFADTSYFLALGIPNDENHDAAIRWARDPDVHALTSEYVLLEVGNYLCSPNSRHVFGTLVKALRKSRRIQVLPCDSGATWRGVDAYLSRPDQSWSLTDCISFNTMPERGLREALTADHHFEQAGFVALLRQP